MDPQVSCVHYVWICVCLACAKPIAHCCPCLNLDFVWISIGKISMGGNNYNLLLTGCFPSATGPGPLLRCQLSGCRRAGSVRLLRHDFPTITVFLIGNFLRHRRHRPGVTRPSSDTAEIASPCIIIQSSHSTFPEEIQKIRITPVHFVLQIFNGK